MIIIVHSAQGSSYTVQVHVRATADVVTLNATVVLADPRRSLVDAAGGGVLLTGALVIRDAHVAAVAEARVKRALAAVDA